MKHFLSTGELAHSEFESLIKRGLELKTNRAASRALENKSVALVFFNPSLRTRASMQVAVFEMGGNAVMLEPGNSSWTLEHRVGAIMDADKTEHIVEFVRVLSRYCALIGVRTFAQLKDWESERCDPVLQAFAAYSEVPVINLESAMFHPCQAMADMMTIRERFGIEKKRVVLSWAWHPRALPMAVPNSFALAAAQAGHDLVIAHPHGYELDDELMQTIENQAEMSGGTIEVTHDVNAAFDDVDVVYAKSWGSRNFYGVTDDELKNRAAYRDLWIVDREKMKRTHDAIFMHCLPVRRNVIVTDDVIDSSSSVVIDEAENRLHIQKAILEWMRDEG